MGKRIYVASSWRNPLHPNIVKLLEEFGHVVYDFRHPGHGIKGFAWRDCENPSADGPGSGAQTIPSYLRAITTARAIEGFQLDKAALDWCDTLVLVLPCGRSAHLEAGYCVGKGKRVYVLLNEAQFEPELMYLLCDGITDEILKVIEWLQ